jgi:hypothetical protein
VRYQNLNVAAEKANLNPTQKKQVETLSSLLDTHKNLLDLPQKQAEQKYATLPEDQKKALVDTFGNEPDKPKRGFFENAARYSGAYWALKGLSKVAQLTDRAYRTGIIALEETNIPGVISGDKPRGITTASEAWKVAGETGELVFNPSRMEKAKKKYTEDRIAVAIKADAGMPLDEIQATGTPAEQKIAAEAAQNRDPLFQDAIDAVKAAKYSPGRQLANALLPESLEGSGFLYKGISGFTDATYRIYTDPTLALGKAKKAYDVANYALFKIVGSPQNVDRVFRNPGVVKFFDTYGTELEKLSVARKAKDVNAATEASTILKRIAPEFGPVAVDEFIKAGVKNAATAKNYLANHADVAVILKGQPARGTPLIPRLDAARKARIAVFTGADRVFNIDKVGQKIVKSLYGTAPQYEDIITGLTTRTEEIGALEKGIGKLKGPSGVVRFSVNQIQGRIDNFARKFTAIPYFKDGYFDVASPDATTQIYRIARLANSRYHSKIITEAFEAGTEGQRKQIFTGLWNTVAEVRDVAKSKAGKSYMDEFAGKGLEKKYAADIVIDGVNKGNPAQFGDQQLALFPYQLSTGIAVPSVIDLDRLSTRSGLIGWIVGQSHQKWAEGLTSWWTILTLAGPRFAVRNATEDLMMHLAIGSSPWGVAKGRMLSTRLRVGKGISGDVNLRGKVKQTVTLDTEAGELGAINKLIRRKELAKYKAKIDSAKTVEDVRRVMAEAVLEDKLAYKLDKRGSQILAEIAQYGNLDRTLADVAEGGKNALRGADQYVNATNDVARFGKMGAVEINGVAYKQAVGEKGFTQFNPVASQASRISWLVQLGVTSNDDLAKIAVANLDKEPEVAIKAMKDYLGSLSEKELGRFQLYEAGGNIDIHARKAYDAVRNLYSKRNGEVNLDLLNKVRTFDEFGNPVVSTKNLSIEDLPNTSKLSPEFISGPTLVPVFESNNFPANLAERAWDAMGEANARFSREPIVINEMIRVRKEMQDSGFEERFIAARTKGLSGDNLAKAMTNAKTEVINLAEELSVGRVLAYVDNPAIRSQLAMSSRNFARFYRATEDFYRRIYRTVKYNPESIRRAALTYEGITHSGFVQQDDNGDSYFFYPGLNPVYQTMQGVADAFGMPEGFKVPMPVEFGAKLNMITPSMNPDSLFPTFSGPVAAVPLKFLFALVPQLDKFEKNFLGIYAEDQAMVKAIFPAHINKFLSIMDRDERNSQYASAARKAATALEAGGHGIKPTWNPETQVWEAPSEGELQAYKDKLGTSTTAVLALRFIFGFFAPASPQLTLKSDMAQWARANERVNFKQVYNNLINRYDGDIDKASTEWIRLYPDQMPYTVSESESDAVSVVRAVDQTVEWIDKNQSLLKQYPQGAPFLMPKTGEFSFDAYKILFTQGIKRSKTLETYLRDVQTARDVQFYYSQKEAYEDELANTYSDSLKRGLKTQWETWKKQFTSARPLLQEEFGSQSDKAIKRQRAFDDLQKMLADNTVKTEPTIRQALSKMTQVYNDYVYSKDLVPGSSAAMENYRDLLKQNVKQELEAIAETNPNAKDAYNVLFSRLIGD